MTTSEHAGGLTDSGFKPDSFPLTMLCSVCSVCLKLMKMRMCKYLDLDKCILQCLLRECTVICGKVMMSAAEVAEGNTQVAN